MIKRGGDGADGDGLSAGAADCRSLARAGTVPVGRLASELDDDDSSGRRARDGRIARAVREPVQLESWCRGAAALIPEAKQQPRPGDPVLAHLRADDREQAAPYTHRAPRAGHGSNSQGPPLRSDAISKQASAGPTRDAWFATVAVAASCDHRQSPNCARRTTAAALPNRPCRCLGAAQARAAAGSLKLLSVASGGARLFRTRQGRSSAEARVAHRVLAGA